MKAELSTHAIFKALGIVNNWPIQNRGMVKLLDRLAETLELTPEEQEVAQFRVIYGEDGTVRAYQYDASVHFERELDDGDAAQLKAMLGPNDNAHWTRQEREVFNEWMDALGGEKWGE